MNQLRVRRPRRTLPVEISFKGNKQNKVFHDQSPHASSAEWCGLLWPQLQRSGPPSSSPTVKINFHIKWGRASPINICGWRTLRCSIFGALRPLEKGVPTADGILLERPDPLRAPSHVDQAQGNPRSRCRHGTRDSPSRRLLARGLPAPRPARRSFAGRPAARVAAGTSGPRSPPATGPHRPCAPALSSSPGPRA